MTNFDTATLSNGITVINRHNKNTPRTAINVFINGGNRSETITGISDVAARLLLKGTARRTSEEIASEMDSYALDMDVDVKQDYIRVRVTCLNDDIDRAIDLLGDIIINSTFEQFEKEIKLLEGELMVELDSPRAKATDNLVKNMYPKHPYGVCSSVILENLPHLSLKATKEYHKNLLNTANTSIIATGNFSTADLLSKLEKTFSCISSLSSEENALSMPVLKENKILTITKEDVSQAQVLRGWYCPPLSSDDFPALSLMNNILGAAGLSCRLFLELRDKKGLAYAVRSSFEVMKYSGTFTVYIGTEPKNIQVALEGIEEEIQKLIHHPVSDEELESAKRNILGKRAIFHETNSQQSYYLGLYHALGLGADFDNQVPELIKATTKEDIQQTARKYLTQKSVVSLLAPSAFLSKFEKETV